MFKGMIKKKIKKAVFELIRETLNLITTAEYGYDKDNDTFTVRFKKDW